MKKFSYNFFQVISQTHRLSFVFLILFSGLLVSCNQAVEEEGEAARSRTLSDEFTVAIHNGASSSDDINPVVRVSGKFLIGQKIILFEDNQCQTQNTYIFATDRTTNLITASSLVTKGVYDFRVRVVTREGILSSCSADGALYDFTLDQSPNPPTIFQDPVNYRDLQLTVTGLEANSNVNFYEGASCILSNKVAQATANSFGTAVHTLIGVAKGTHTYSVDATVLGKVVGCSDLSASIEVTSKPSAMRLASGYVTPSSEPYPRLVIDGLIPGNGRTVELHATADCSSSPLDAKVVTQTTEILIGLMNNDQETKRFYAKHDDECSGPDVFYEYTLDIKPQNLTNIFSVAAPLQYTPRIDATNIYPTNFLTTTTVSLFENDTSCAGAANATKNSSQNIVFVERNTNIPTDGTYSYTLQQKISGPSPHSAPYQVTQDIISNCSDTTVLSVNFKPAVHLASSTPSPGPSPFPKFNVSNIENGANIGLFSDSNCTTSVEIVEEAAPGAGITVDEVSEFITLKSPQTNGTTTYYIGHAPTDMGATFCSDPINYTVNGTETVATLKDGIPSPWYSGAIGFKLANKLSGSAIYIYTTENDCDNETNPVVITSFTDFVGYSEYDIAPLTVDQDYTFFFREKIGATYDSLCFNQAVPFTLDRKPNSFVVLNSNNHQTLQPQFQISNIIPGATITLYDDANCTGSTSTYNSGAYTANGTTVTFTLASELSADGNHTFSVKQDTGAGLSLCSNNANYLLITEPTVALNTGVISPGKDMSPEIKISNLLTYGNRTINVYNSNDCSGPALTTITNTTDASELVYEVPLTTFPNDGTYYFSAKQSIGGGGNSDCSANVAGYTLDAKLVSMTLTPGTTSPSKTNLTPSLRYLDPVTMAGVNTTIKIYKDISCSVAVTQDTFTYPNTYRDITLPAITQDGSFSYFALQVLNNGSDFYTSDCSSTSLLYEVDGKPTDFYIQPLSDRNDLTPIMAIDDNYYDPDVNDTNTSVNFYFENDCSGTPLSKVAAAVPYYTHGYSLENAGASIFPSDGVYTIYAKVTRGSYTSDCSLVAGTIALYTTPIVKLDESMTQPISVGTPLIELDNIPPGEQANIYVYGPAETVPATPCSAGAFHQVATNGGSTEKFSFSLDPGKITGTTNTGQSYKIYAGRNDPVGGTAFDDDLGCSQALEIEVTMPDGIEVTSANPGASLIPTFKVLGTLAPGAGQSVAIFMGDDPCTNYAGSTLVSTPILTASPETSVTILNDNLMASDTNHTFYAMVYEGSLPPTGFKSCRPTGATPLTYTLVGAPTSVTPTISNQINPVFGVSGFDKDSGLTLELFDNQTDCQTQSFGLADENIAATSATQNITWSTNLLTDGLYTYYARVSLNRASLPDYFSDCHSFTYLLDTQPKTLNISTNINVTDNDYDPNIEASNLIVGENITFYANDVTCSVPGNIISTLPITGATETFAVDLSSQQPGATSDDGIYQIYAKQSAGASTTTCSTVFTYTLDGAPRLTLAGSPLAPYSDPQPEIEVNNLYVTANQQITFYLDNEDGGSLCDVSLGSVAITSNPQTITLPTALSGDGSYKIRAIQDNTVSGYTSSCSDGSGIHLEYTLDLTSSTINVTDSSMPINPIVTILNTISTTEVPSATIDVFTDNCTTSVVQGGSAVATDTDNDVDVSLYLTQDGTTTLRYLQAYTGSTPTCSTATGVYALNAAPTPSSPALSVPTPGNDPEPTLTWDNIITPISTDQVTLRIYDDVGCTNLLKSQTYTSALGATTANIDLTDTLTQDAAYTFYAVQFYERLSVAGPNFTSNCSATNISYTLDGTPGVAVDSPPGGMLNPNFLLTNLITDATVHVYPTLSDCQGDSNELPLTDAAGSGISRSVTADLSSLNDGNHTLYFNQQKVLGAKTYFSTCSAAPAHLIDRKPTNIVLTSGMLRPNFAADLNWNTGTLHLYDNQSDCDSDTTTTQDLEIGLQATVTTTTSQAISVTPGSEFTQDGTHTLYIKQINAGIHTSCSSFSHVVDGRITGAHGPSVDSIPSKTEPDYLLSTTQDFYDVSDVATAPDIKVYHVPIGVNPATTPVGCTGTQVKLLATGASGTEGDNSTRIVDLALDTVTDTKKDYRIYATTTIPGIGYESKCSDNPVDYSINTTPTISLTGSSPGKMHTISVNAGNLSATNDIVNFYDNDECSGGTIDTYVATAPGSQVTTVDLTGHSNFADGNSMRIYANQQAADNGHISECTAPLNAIDYQLEARPILGAVAAGNEFDSTQNLPLVSENNWVHQSGYIRVFLDKSGRAPCDAASDLQFNFVPADLAVIPSSLNLDFTAICGTLNTCQGTYQISARQDIDGTYAYNGTLSRCSSTSSSLTFDVKPQLQFADGSTQFADVNANPTFKVLNVIKNVDGVQLYQSPNCEAGTAVADITPNSDTSATDGLYDSLTHGGVGLAAAGTYYYSATVTKGGFTSDCSTPILYDYNGMTITMITPSPSDNMTPMVTVGNLGANDAVTLYRDSNCQHSVGSLTTNGAGDPLTFVSSQLPTGGFHEFHATRLPGGVGPATACSVASATYHLDIEPSSLVLANVSPTDVNPSPTITANGVLDLATIKIYSDNTCNTLMGSANTVNGQTSIDIATNPLSADGIYQYHITQHRTGFDSDCSSVGVTYEYLSRPTDVQTLTVSPGGDSTPTIRVFGVANGSLVKIFTNNTCSAGSEVGSVIATGTEADVNVASGKITIEGGYNFYAKQITNGGAGTASQCSSAFSAYTYQTAKQNMTLKFNPESATANAKMGSSVSVSGNVAVVGAPGDNKAYVYRHDGTNWSQEAELANISGVSFGATDSFGSSVSINPAGNRIIVGAPGYSSNKGKVYIFNSPAPGTWSYIHGIVKNVFIFDGMKTGINNDLFGQSVLINDSNEAFIGVPGHDFSGAADAGAIVKINNVGGSITQEYVKLNPETDSSGSYTEVGTWNASTNTPTLVQSTGTEGDFYYVDTAGVQAIGAAAANLDCKVGNVVMFKGGEWQLYAFTGGIGEKMKMYNTTVLASAPNNEAVYAFDSSNTSNKSIKLATMTPSIDFADSLDVDLDATTSKILVAIGAPAYNSNQGQVYLYNLDITTTPFTFATHPLMPSLTWDSPDPTGRFGEQVALDTSGSVQNLIVGAPNVNSSRGAVYFFNGTDFNQNTLIIPYDVTTGVDALGSAVDASAGRLLFGAPNADTNGGVAGQDHGRAYFYEP